MTNKTEHDSHGSKTVEISDMKYNIFKVCILPFLYSFHLLPYLEAKIKPELNIRGNLWVEVEFTSTHQYFRSILIFVKTLQVEPTLKQKPPAYILILLLGSWLLPKAGETSLLLKVVLHL